MSIVENCIVVDIGIVVSVGIAVEIRIVVDIGIVVGVVIDIGIDVRIVNISVNIMVDTSPGKANSKRKNGDGQNDSKD